MSEWINERIQDILSSVILYGSPNESEGTTDCYMKYPDDSKKWVKYDNKEFFDTLSYCLDASVDEDTIYCRHFTNQKGEVIKFEKPIAIYKSDISDFLRSSVEDNELMKNYGSTIECKLVKSEENYLRMKEINETFQGINHIKYIDKIIDIIFQNIGNVKEDYNIYKITLKGDESILRIDDVYDKLIKKMGGKFKNENEFSVDYYYDEKEKKDSTIPYIISRNCVKLVIENFDKIKYNL